MATDRDALIEELEWAVLGMARTGDTKRVKKAREALSAALASAPAAEPTPGDALRDIWRDCHRAKSTSDGRKQGELHALADWVMAKVGRLRATHTAQPAPQAGAAEPVSNEVERLQRALVYVAHSLHSTRQYMLAPGITLSDGDTVKVDLEGWSVRASTNPHQQAHPTEQPSQDAETVLAAMADGYKVEKTVPWDAMTDEANLESAWMVSRSAPPFCDNKSMRVWTGPTAIAAVRRAQAAIGPAIAARAAQAQGESTGGTPHG